VLVHGGGGAVGTAAVMLAKWAGAWVATTVSRQEQEVVARAAGADLVINRRTEEVPARVRQVTKNAGVDRIVDVNLVANVEIDMACLANNGTVSAYATQGPTSVLSIPFLSAMVRGFVFRLILVYAMPEQAHRDAVRDINACLAASAYRPVIGMCVPLDRIAEAHEAQESGKVVGKILVDIGD
jgi:NADPH2:quinone reductase